MADEGTVPAGLRRRWLVGGAAALALLVAAGAAVVVRRGGDGPPALRTPANLAGYAPAEPGDRGEVAFLVQHALVRSGASAGSGAERFYGSGGNSYHLLVVRPGGPATSAAAFEEVAGTVRHLGPDDMTRHEERGLVCAATPDGAHGRLCVWGGERTSGAVVSFLGLPLADLVRATAEARELAER